MDFRIHSGTLSLQQCLTTTATIPAEQRRAAFLEQVKAAVGSDAYLTDLIDPIMLAYDQGQNARADETVKLDLSCSRLKKCPPLPPNLTDLNLGRNDGLNGWPENLPSTLRALSLAACPIRAVPENLATLLPNLQRLNIAGTLIDELPDLPDTLIELNVSKLVIPTLFERSFPSLQILSLRFYNDSKLPANFAVLFPQLQLLDIFGMAVEELPELSDTLTKLDASRTRLKTLPEKRLQSLQSLQLSECTDLTLPDNLASLYPNLRELKICKMLLDKLPELPDTLVHLDVSDTTLIALPNKTFLLLKKLTLSGCRNLTLPDNLAALYPSLEELMLHATLIERLPDLLPETLVGLFANCSALKTLPRKLPLSLKKLGLMKSRDLTQVELSPDFIEKIFQLEFFWSWDTPLAYLHFNDEKSRCLRKSEFEFSTTLGLSYRQTYPLSCAAVSLLVITQELDAEHKPALNAQSEALLYKVTSGFEGELSELCTARGSLPPYIIRQARQLGLVEAFYFPPNSHTQAMQSDTVFPTVITMFMEENILINTHTAPPLETDTIEMRFMARVDFSGTRLAGPWDEINHCIAVRPNGSCMDPAYGINFKSVDDYIRYSKSQDVCYQDTGMAIQFKNVNK